MSYSWTGPPTQFNGTDAITGGDSGKFNIQYLFAHVPSITPVAARRMESNINHRPCQNIMLTQLHSHRESEPMVPVG
jgi:hypothetical protein